MGFNPRIAPYTVTKQIDARFTSKAANDRQDYAVYKFPFAGELISAHANIRVIGAAGVADAAAEATTNTGVDGAWLWKHAADDTTATYATGLRALQRTGAANSSTGGGINWRLPGTTGVPQGMYPFSDNNTADSARRRFVAGDGVLFSLDVRGATDAHRTYSVDLQMDYIIGFEDGATPAAGTGPASA